MVFLIDQVPDRTDLSRVEVMFFFKKRRRDVRIYLLAPLLPLRVKCLAEFFLSYRDNGECFPGRCSKHMQT